MPPRKSVQQNADSPADARTKNPVSLFLVYGTDDLSATRKADEIVARLCPPDEQAFGLETLDPDPDL
ncbi:MAG: hypothetical protein PHU50_04210, partial [Kiritimatiellae bacterium]|nr:hypothetical protein [Kiritimatiellia bacterium]